LAGGLFHQEQFLKMGTTDRKWSNLPVMGTPLRLAQRVGWHATMPSKAEK
jgi:hypothetical protein